MNNVQSMCSLTPNSSCSETCQTDSDEDEVSNMSVDTSVDMEQFCFYSCRVPDEETTTYGEKCQDLSDGQKLALKREGRTGIDLATLNMAAMEEDLYAIARSRDGSVQKEEGGHKPKKINITGRHAFAAAAEAQSARSAMVAKHALTSIEAAQRDVSVLANANADNVNTVHKLQTLVEQQRAAVARAKEKTKIALKDIEEAPAKATVAAVAEARKIMLEKAEDAETRATQIANLFNPPSSSVASDAAAKAMAPFNNVAATSMTMQGLYSAQAQDLNNQAKRLQDDAIKYATAATYYAHAGSAAAPRMFDMAKGMLNQAKSIDKQAQATQAIAESITENIPKWQFAGTMAGIRASAIATPTPLPPLPVLNVNVAV